MSDDQPRVFVVQRVTKRARDGQIVPAYDLSPALRYGRLVDLVGASTKPFRPQEFVPQIRERLTTFSDQDSLLAIGSPIIVGIATCLAAQANNGRVALLQWSSGDYVRVEVDVAPIPEVWRREWNLDNA